MFGVGKVFKKHFETMYFYSSIKLIKIYNIDIDDKKCLLIFKYVFYHEFWRIMWH